MEAKTMPEIAEAMTPQQVARAIGRLKAMLSPRADIWLMVASDRSKPLCLFLGHDYTSHKHTINADTHPALFEMAEDWITKRAVVQRDTTIRKMALAIIDLTDQHGKCERSALVRQFSEGEVSEFAEAACKRAGEMSGNAPFEVVA